MNAEQLEWAPFEGEWGAFKVYAFTKGRVKGRDWPGPWTCELSCGKVHDNLKVLFERVAQYHPGEHPTFGWLLDIEDPNFGWNFEDHLIFLKDHRHNIASTRAQTMRGFQKPLEWAAKFVGDMPREQRTALRLQYKELVQEASSEGSKDDLDRSSKAALKRALDPDMEYEEYVSLVQAHVEAVLAAEGTGSILDTPVARASAAVLSMMTIGRRPVMVYRMHYAQNEEDATYLIEEELIPNGGTILTPVPDFVLLTPSEKCHTVAIICPVAKQLLEHVCSNLETGDYVFTPKSVGVNTEKLYFESGDFSSFFERLTRDVLGVKMTPKTIRRMRARAATQAGVPAKAQESIAFGMATSVKQLRGRYSAADLLDEGWLGSQMAQFQFDKRLGGTSQNVILPVPSPLADSTFDFVPARWLRAEGQASVLLALFVEVSPGLFELSSRVVRVQPSFLKIACSLKIDPASGSQRWRAREFSTRKAREFFDQAGDQLAGWLATAQPIDCSVSSPAFAQARDFVLSMEHFTIGEIKSVLPNGDLDLQLATEIPNTQPACQSVFEFQHSKKNTSVKATDVVWPIDINFSFGRFTLSKGSRLPCV